jgi:cold shock CspA family protein
VEADSASAIGRYLLARAYRDQGNPKKTMEVLEQIIKTDFKQVRAYVEYTRAMLELNEPIRKCAATLSQCRLDGESDPVFIGLYGGLLFVDGRYADAKKMWDHAKELGFSYEERMKRQYIPKDPSDSTKPRRFSGTIQHVKPGYVLIQPEAGPLVISTTTIIGTTTLQRLQRVIFELTFSAKGPFAENLQLSN